LTVRSVKPSYSTTDWIAGLIRIAQSASSKLPTMMGS
jgi:hypothetical protein